MKRLLSVFTLALLLVVAACGPADDRTAGEDVDTLQSQREMDDFRMEVEEALADADQAIDSLQVGIAGAAEQAEIDSTLADLREKRDSVQQDLQELQMATEERFDDLKAEIEEELDELESAIRAARDRYETEEETTTS